MKGPELHHLVGELTHSWHPDLRTLIALADPLSFFPITIRTSVPLPQWQTTNITLIGDAIHTMTPGRGVGANTALRDARLLCHNLTAARDGKLPLLTAIRDYETQMIGYGFDAVKKSRKQMTARACLSLSLDVGEVRLDGRVDQIGMGDGRHVARLRQFGRAHVGQGRREHSGYRAG
jgi:2-polyprenyl-6-methoxyphenol hydroxylase-like FAD-dependent oxidoreductase